VLPMMFTHGDQILPGATLTGNFHPYNSPSVLVTGKTDSRGILLKMKIKTWILLNDFRDENYCCATW
jgi:hypothetical protein